MPYLLTGNRLETGDVLWWDGTHWSRHIRDAATMEKTEAETLADQFRAAETISDLAAVEVTVEDGRFVPTTTRQRVRAIGPSVRPDFALPSLPVESI